MAFSLLPTPAPRLRAALAAFAVIAGLLLPPVAHAELPPPGLADLVQAVMPSVVNITARSLAPRNTAGLNAAGNPPPSAAMSPEMRAKTALGSGFVIDPDGLIVTNNHVIDGAFSISVTFSDGTVANASLVAATKIGDIALIKVNMGHKLPALQFGDSTVMRAGDAVIAIGNPLGFSGSVTTGIVSALNRDIMISPFDDFIQTDAAINHGNSGGPLFNLAGEVIGVNTAIYTPGGEGGSIGLGFAIPSFCVQFVINQLRSYGFVRAGEIGAHVQDVTAEIAAGAGLPPTSRTAGILPGSAGWGVIVTSVAPGGPAAAAGMREGDILLKVDGQPIADARALARTVAIHPLDTPVTIAMWRDGAPAMARPVVREWLSGEQSDKAALAQTAGARVATADMGLRLAALTPDLRAARDLPADQDGVLVTRVMPDSIAGDRGLAEGDVILKVMATPVATPEEVLGSLRQMIDNRRAMVLLLVSGPSGLRWVPLPIEPDVVASLEAK